MSATKPITVDTRWGPTLTVGEAILNGEDYVAIHYGEEFPILLTYEQAEVLSDQIRSIKLATPKGGTA